MMTSEVTIKLIMLITSSPSKHKIFVYYLYNGVLYTKLMIEFKNRFYYTFFNEKMMTFGL